MGIRLGVSSRSVCEPRDRLPTGVLRDPRCTGCGIGQGRVKGLMNSQGGKRNSSDSRDAVGSHLVEG